MINCKSPSLPLFPPHSLSLSLIHNLLIIFPQITGGRIFAVKIARAFSSSARQFVWCLWFHLSQEPLWGNRRYNFASFFISCYLSDFVLQLLCFPVPQLEPTLSEHHLLPPLQLRPCQQFQEERASFQSSQETPSGPEWTKSTVRPTYAEQSKGTRWLTK